MLPQPLRVHFTQIEANYLLASGCEL
jgi:hypothetical protein